MSTADLVVVVSVVLMGQTRDEPTKKFAPNSGDRFVVDAPRGSGVLGFATEGDYRAYLEAVKRKSETDIDALGQGVVLLAAGTEVVFAGPMKTMGLALGCPASQALVKDGRYAGKVLYIPDEHLRPNPRPDDPPPVALPRTTVLSPRLSATEPGRVADLWNEFSDYCVVCSDVHAMDSYAKFAIARDADGLAELSKDGKIATVTNGIQIRIIKSYDNRFLAEGLPTLEARILSGPQKGKLVWVLATYAASVTWRVEFPAERPRAKNRSGESRPPISRAASALRIAENLERSKKTAAAIKAYEDVAGRFPGTPEASNATKRLKAIRACSGSPWN